MSLTQDNSPVSPLLRHWPLVAFLVSAGMLATAHAFETFGNLAPCHLCLKQREVYWVALGVAAVGVVTQRFAWAKRTRLAVLWMLAVAFLFGAGLAAFHAGVEWKWWPGPQTCTGGATVTIEDMSALLSGAAKASAPACDVAAWRMFGLSMAGWNTLVSLGLAIMSFAAAMRAFKRGSVR